MKGSEFVPVKRKWLNAAMQCGAKQVQQFLNAVFAFAFEGVHPNADALAPELYALFKSDVVPEINKARQQWRTFDIRRAQFLELIDGTPDKVRERYEAEFATMAHRDAEDFYNYLDEITPDINAIKAAGNGKAE